MVAVFIILIFGFIACIWLRMYNLDINLMFRNIKEERWLIMQLMTKIT